MTPPNRKYIIALPPFNTTLIQYVTCRSTCVCPHTILQKGVVSLELQSRNYLKVRSWPSNFHVTGLGGHRVHWWTITPDPTIGIATAEPEDPTMHACQRWPLWDRHVIKENLSSPVKKSYSRLINAFYNIEVYVPSG